MPPIAAKATPSYTLWMAHNVTSMKNNYHTHSTYCDGKEPLQAFVKAAEEAHFDQLGFSSHAPVPFENDFGISFENLPIYRKEIETLNATTDVQLLAALECDYIPGISTPFDTFRHDYHLDYIIGGVHLVRPSHGDKLWFIDGSKREIYDNGLSEFFHNDIKTAVTTFWEQTFEMIETQHLDIIAHLDKIKMHNQHRFFTEEEIWYEALADHALDLIHRHNVIIEINSRGIYKKRCDSYYPSDKIMKKAAKMGIPFVISSDAHTPDELDALYDETAAKLQECGITDTVHFDGGQWK